ncbi:MAG: DUF308 domain-containing protein [Methanospirillum sp.]|uniref:HdeD family acid-resistance protein n=1 Tax=Methanospirillum sp. TaxID=45200 RepID=UPI0023697AED|nr:DUF308 domain-containing protein [Methanospirillum sp.]MDD1728904.1 DUF308 domain-containing protein [Methanospirillum sp.]
MEFEVLTKGGMLIRGIFALIIGILCFFLPIGMEAVIAYIIGIFLLIISLVTGGMSISAQQPGRIPVLILSIVGVIIAVMTFISPFIVVTAITILIAFWAVVTGIAELTLAYALKELPFRVLLGINGFIAVLFGFLIGFAPLPTQGSMVLIILLGIYCLVFGIISIITGLLMKKGDLIIT